MINILRSYRLGSMVPDRKKSFFSHSEKPVTLDYITLFFFIIIVTISSIGAMLTIYVFIVHIPNR